MDTINLKTALTFHVTISSTLNTSAAFLTKAFRGSIQTQGDPRNFKPVDRICFKVLEIKLDSDTTPWYKLEKPVTIDVVWSSVLSVQHSN